QPGAGTSGGTGPGGHRASARASLVTGHGGNLVGGIKVAVANLWSAFEQGLVIGPAFTPGSSGPSAFLEPGSPGFSLWCVTEAGRSLVNEAQRERGEIPLTRRKRRV